MGASENLATNLRQLRAAKGLSINRFAPQLGVSKSTLQEIERGHTPNLDTVDCIAQHLGLSPGLLISDPRSLPDTSLLLPLLRTMRWYSAWPLSDQEEFARLLAPLLEVLAKHPQVTP